MSWASAGGARGVAAAGGRALDVPGYGAYIFDWDGTLADSHRANYSAIREALGSVGVDVDWGWYSERNGLSAGEMATAAAAAAGVDIDVGAITELRDGHFLDRVSEVEPVDPVLSLVRRLHNRVPLAVATGGPRRTVVATMDLWGVKEYFSAIVTRDEVSSGKPAPDLFLLAARRLGVPAEHCLAYEDSAEGMRAAHSAGMDVVDVRPFLVSAQEGGGNT